MNLREKFAIAKQTPFCRHLLIVFLDLRSKRTNLFGHVSTCNLYIKAEQMIF